MCSTAKVELLNCNFILWSKYFRIGEKLYDGKGLETHTPFDFQAETLHSCFSCFKYIVIYRWETYFGNHYPQKNFYQENNSNQTFVVFLFSLHFC